jgi:cytochrome c553
MTAQLVLWRSLVVGPAAALFLVGAAAAQTMPLVERIMLCAGCHGEDGNSRIENVPSLAGQPEFFMLNQLILMREGVRQIEAMAPFVKDLTDADITALAQHYAKLTPKPSDEKVDPVLVKQGAAISAQRRCGSCHLPTLAGQDQMPRLANQRVDYMIYAMKALRDDKRTGADTLMTAALLGLNDADLAALAHYAASR